MKSFLNVVFTIDQKFIQHFTVALTSLLENNKDIKFEVYVIHDMADLRPLDQALDHIKSRYHITPNLIVLDDSIFDNYKINQDYSKATYYRLMLTEVLPKTLNKVLFLDADLIVNGSIMELAAFEFQDQLLLAADDSEVDAHIIRLTKIGFPIKNYFNAGVMLINLKAWRDFNVTPQFMDIANRHMDKVVWYDQDVLNMFFSNNWELMSSKYNAVHLRKKTTVVPIIVHYAGPSKPWLYIHDHPYKYLYWKYLKLTPYKDFKYADYNFKEIVRKCYIKFLDFLRLRPQAIHKDIKF